MLNLFNELEFHFNPKAKIEKFWLLSAGHYKEDIQHSKVVQSRKLEEWLKIRPYGPMTIKVSILKAWLP